MYIYKHVDSSSCRESTIGFPEKQTDTLKSYAINLKDFCLFLSSFLKSKLVPTIVSLPCDYATQPTFVEHFWWIILLTLGFKQNHSCTFHFPKTPT